VGAGNETHVLQIGHHIPNGGCGEV
jgi:hypothetical protein